MEGRPLNAIWEKGVSRMRIDSFLRVQRDLKQSKIAMDRALQQLSSQKRINSAADDSVGLRLVKGLESRIRSLQQVNAKNIPSGKSLLTSAKSALLDLKSKLNEAQLVAVQATDPDISQAKRDELNIAFQEILSEAQSMAQNVNWNGNNLLNGDLNVQLQVGAEVGDRFSFSIKSFSLEAQGLNNLDFSDVASAKEAVTAVELAMSKIEGTISKVDSWDTSLSSLSTSNIVRITTLQEAKDTRELINLPEVTLQYETSRLNLETQSSLLTSSLEFQASLFQSLIRRF